MTIASPSDFRVAARRRLPRFLFDYIDGGAGDEVTMQRNIEDLRAVNLHQKVLRNVADVDTSTIMMGERVSLPVALGPIGIAGLSARRGEVQAARAASAKGVPFCLSTVSLCTLSEVASAATQPIWFQLYLMRDRGLVREFIEEAWVCGITTLIMTVDMPLPGPRYRDIRSGFSGGLPAFAFARRVAQALAKPRWMWDVGVHGRPHTLGNITPHLGRSAGLDDFIGWMRENFDPSASWLDLRQIRERWPGKLLVKGVMNANDATNAAQLGVDGIIVSNHGGRQLDGVCSTARALPPIVSALDGKISVLVDGGVRSGFDVVRFLSLGASGVLLGRLWVYALAARSQVGVETLLDLIGTEMRLGLALGGMVSVNELHGPA